MAGERNPQTARVTMSRAVLMAAAPVLVLLLSGCGSSSVLSGSSLSSLNIFDSKKVSNDDPKTEGTGETTANTDLDCPEVAVRSGAATLMIGSAAKGAESGVMDLKYQGTITRTARECHLNAGVMTIKVGVEGRIITGPAGGPGTVDVPLRVAVVQEGVEPKAIVSTLAHIPVTIAGEADRVSFSHVESGISFPMPVPAGLLDAYVIYVGFDSMAPPEKKAPVKRKPRAKTQS